MNRPALGVMLLGATAVAMFVAGIWLLPGLLMLLTAPLAAMSIQLVNPRFWGKLRAIRADPSPVLPETLEFQDPTVVEVVGRLRRARLARDRAVARSPHGRRQALGPCRSSVADLERRAIVTAARAEYVRTFLKEQSEAGASLDGDGREALRRVEARGAALVATLEHLAAILEAVPAKLTDIDLMRIEEDDRLIGTDTADAEKDVAQLGAPQD
jgi:hypothetical protein